MACVYSSESREKLDDALKRLYDKASQYFDQERHLVSFNIVYRKTNQTAIKAIKERYKPIKVDNDQYNANNKLWIFDKLEPAQKAALAIKNCKAENVLLDGKPV